jgi:competence protein ComEC
VRFPVASCAVAFVAGVGAGVASSIPGPHLPAAVIGLLAAAAVAIGRQLKPALRRPGFAASCLVAGLLHGTSARDAALHTPLRARLETVIGGASIDTVGVLGRHEPFRVRGVLTEDAVDAGDFVSLHLASTALFVNRVWLPVSGGLVVSVTGTVARDRLRAWSAGRTIEAPISFRRPTRYLDDGVPDFERDAALGGITLFGSVKSALLVEVTATGGWIDEASAKARAGVRSAVAKWVSPHGLIPAAIVTAVLIGDRAGLPDEVRARLQAAGTYHVIAISGGNIAILAALIVGAFAVVGMHGRYVAAATIAALLAYAQVAAAGPSVWRAAVMGVLYFGARVFDHRTPPWHAIAIAAALIAGVQPLDVRDAGFLLTFGATIGLLALARRLTTSPLRLRATAWVAASVAASLAAEIVLLPVSATVFSRVTGAGLLLNLVAIPAMAVVQVGGMVVIACQSLDVIASAAGWVSAQAATVLVESARLVDVVPWLVRRVPSPPHWMVIVYYVSLLVAYLRGSPVLRFGSRTLLVMVAALIVTGTDPFARSSNVSALRLTMIDVGQGESMLIELPGAASLLIDTGGAPFGGGSFDIGTRVLTPALWARGVRHLGELLITHGDPDHIGGAASVMSEFHPSVVWWGIPVPPHLPSQTFLAAAAETGRVEYRRRGEAIGLARATVRVLNPPEPQWERQRVRNDDSVVLEVTYGDVALLLTGDISAEVERAIAPRLTPARVRVLKVAHHGSRTSTADALLESWHPQVALISCGRGNTFGHPAPEVIDRLNAIGARIYRTDRDGEITLTSDGHSVQVKTFAGEKR